MSILKNIFKTKKHSIKTYADFWNWFKDNEKAFFKAVKSNENIERDFFDKLSSKLSELRKGFYYLTGKYPGLAGICSSIQKPILTQLMR